MAPNPYRPAWNQLYNHLHDVLKKDMDKSGKAAVAGIIFTMNALAPHEKEEKE